MSAPDPRAWPLELRLAKGGGALAVSFDDGSRFELPAEYLRVMTGSAQDRGHGSGPRPPIPGKARVAITDVRPVGAYAVRLVFDDGHDSGIYSWELLHDLGLNRPEYWDTYLQILTAAGMTREPQSRN